MRNGTAETGWQEISKWIAALCLFAVAAVAGAQDCNMDKVWIAIDTASMAADCGAFADSGGTDLFHGVACAQDMIALGRDVDAYQNDCGTIDHSPGGCDWWDLWCAAMNVFRGPWGGGDWGWNDRPGPFWYGPECAGVDGDECEQFSKPPKQCVDEAQLRERLTLEGIPPAQQDSIVGLFKCRPTGIKNVETP